MRNDDEVAPLTRREKNWYVLYTTPRAEKRVKQRLDEQDIENYLPVHRVPRAWSDRIKMIDKPLFSSYIFVRCSEVRLRQLLAIYGVVRIVFHNGKPAVVRQKEINAIQEFLTKATGHVLCVGEEAEILAGAMKHVSGKVQKIKKKYLVLYIEQLDATVSVNIANVAPVNRLK